MIFAEDKGIGIKGWLSGSKPKAATTEKQPENMVLDKHRVAVLPLANFSPDKNDEYFSDGMTEELITAISAVQGLRVIARTSVMHYKEAKKGVSQIGTELKVGTILEGSVRKASNRIRVTVQLIDSATEEHLWASNYDRQMEDIFEIQTDIASKVAEALKTKFLGQQKTQKPPENLEAYTLCLRARSLWNKRTKEANERAMLLFQEALTLDPNYARAYAGLADCWSVGQDWGFIEREEGISKTKIYIAKTLELDDSLAEPHATLGYLLSSDFEWDRSEKEFQKAISLNPSYPSAHQWYGAYLLDVGKPSEALAEIRKAYELDPLTPIIVGNLAFTYGAVGRPDDALSCLNRLLDMDPGFAPPYADRSIIYAIKGNKEEALANLELFRSRMGEADPVSLGVRAQIQALVGNRDEALALIKKLIPQAGQPGSAVWAIAGSYAMIGKREEAFDWADRALAKGQLSARYLRYAPFFANLKDDPRYHALFKKMHLTG
jgi:adenylate cyclase